MEESNAFIYSLHILIDGKKEALLTTELRKQWLINGDNKEKL